MPGSRCRSCLLVWGLIGALAILSGQLPAAAAADADDTKAPPTKILLIGHDRDSHPYRTHEYLTVCKLLAACLRQTPGVETVVSNRWPQDPADAAGVTAILVYAPYGANILLDGPHRDAVKQLLDQGAGLSAVHWATGARGDEFGQLWLQYLGGWFNSDFSKVQHIEKRLVQADPQHPICRGWSDFTLFDEYYFDLRFAPDAKPLVTAEVDGQPNTVAWTYERSGEHGGKSFGFDGGHYFKNFADDRFRQLVVNGILWTAGREMPAEGAPCKLEPADLELPPRPTAAAE